VEFERHDGTDHHSADAPDRGRDRKRKNGHPRHVDAHEGCRSRIFRTSAQRFADRRFLQDVPHPDDDDRGDPEIPKTLRGYVNPADVDRRETRPRLQLIGLAAPYQEHDALEERQQAAGQQDHSAHRQLAQRRAEDERAQNQADDQRYDQRADEREAEREVECLLKRVERQRAEDDERALREIDRAGDAVNERKTQRDECENAALKDAAKGDLYCFAQSATPLPEASATRTCTAPQKVASSAGSARSASSQTSFES